MGGGEAVWAVGPAVSLSAAPAEWWQRLAVAWRAWAGRHERLVRRLRVARAVWLWGSLAWLLVLLVVRPEVRESLRVFVAVYWLLLGFASCLGFQAFEELARRVTAHVTRPGLLDLLLGDPGDRGPATGYPQYGLGPWGGWSTGGAWGAVRGAPGYVRLQG